MGWAKQRPVLLAALSMVVVLSALAGGCAVLRPPMACLNRRVGWGGMGGELLEG